MSGRVLKSVLRFGFAAAAAAVLATAIAACGEDEPATGGEIEINMASYPDYLDPALSYTVEGWEALWVTYLPLLTYAHEPGDAGTEIIPALAEDLPTVSEDGREYQLFLRKGMKYSDGSPIKASDFEYAVERMFDNNSGGSSFYSDIVGAAEYQSGKAKEIAGIKTDDKSGSISIELKRPRGTFQDELALMFVAPVPQDTPNKDMSADPPPASGQYMIKDAKPGRSFSLVRNPQFKTVLDAGADLPEGGVDQINVTKVLNQETQINDVERNKVDFLVDRPPGDRLAEIKAKYGDRFRPEKAINIYYLWMNNQEPPFDDLKVRQAINYAVDPDAVARFFGGLLTPSQQILPEGIPGYEKYELYPGPDLEKAKELIAEADPEDKDVTVWTDDESSPKKLGAYTQDLLDQLGFNADLKVISGDVYFATIGNEKTPNLDIGFTDWFQDYPHPNDYFEPLLSGDSIFPTNNQNFSYTDIPELNRKIDELGEQQLDGEVESQYADLDRSYMEQAVWAPIGSAEEATFVSDRIDFDQVYYHLLFAHDWTSFHLDQ